MHRLEPLVEKSFAKWLTIKAEVHFNKRSPNRWLVKLLCLFCVYDTHASINAKKKLCISIKSSLFTSQTEPKKTTKKLKRLISTFYTMCTNYCTRTFMEGPISCIHLYIRFYAFVMQVSIISSK